MPQKWGASGFRVDWTTEITLGGQQATEKVASKEGMDLKTFYAKRRDKYLGGDGPYGYVSVDKSPKIRGFPARFSVLPGGLWTRTGMYTHTHTHTRAHPHTAHRLHVTRDMRHPSYGKIFRTRHTTHEAPHTTRHDLAHLTRHTHPHTGTASQGSLKMILDLGQDGLDYEDVQLPGSTRLFLTTPCWGRTLSTRGGVVSLRHNALWRTEYRILGTWRAKCLDE